MGAISFFALVGIAANISASPPAQAQAPKLDPAPIAASIVAPGSFADLVDQVKGSVVAVKVKRTADQQTDETQSERGPRDPMEEMFRRFGQRDPREHAQPRSNYAMGSGFVISADGYVVTNNHVVENAREVEVSFDAGKTVQAAVVGTDKKTDLALLKIKDGGDYPFVQFSSKTPRVGDWVIAVGNPFGLGGSVTAGIVSARGRDIGSGPYDDYLQIDAPVNQGNSGGPTFDASGQVIGVNTAIYSPSGGSVGIGFAIPAETAKNVIASLKDKGVVSRGYLGVQIQPVTSEIADSLGLKEAKGALIADAGNGPAAQAGVRSGDVITSVNGEKIDNARDLARKIAAISPNAAVKIGYVRMGAEKTAELKLAAAPGEKMAKHAAAQDESHGLAALGLGLAAPSSGEGGALVTEVEPDGLAAQKGFQPGDVILEVDGKRVSQPADVVAGWKKAKKEGAKAVLLRVKSTQGVRFVAIALKSA